MKVNTVIIATVVQEAIAVTDVRSTFVKVHRSILSVWVSMGKQVFEKYLYRVLSSVGDSMWLWWGSIYSKSTIPPKLYLNCGPSNIGPNSGHLCDVVFK